MNLKNETAIEGHVRLLTRLFSNRGISVRREKLSRGVAFRVKSGGCHFVGKDHLFIDRRLPIEQQLAILVDLMLERRFAIDREEAEQLSANTKKLLGISA